jgi:hypothetical protein
MLPLRKASRPRVRRASFEIPVIGMGNGKGKGKGGARLRTGSCAT